MWMDSPIDPPHGQVMVGVGCSQLEVLDRFEVGIQRQALCMAPARGRWVPSYNSGTAGWWVRERISGLQGARNLTNVII